MLKCSSQLIRGAHAVAGRKVFLPQCPFIYFTIYFAFLLIVYFFVMHRDLQLYVEISLHQYMACDLFFFRRSIVTAVS